MLKYVVKPSKETAFMDFPITNFYVSPDLSYISGITDYNTGLVNGEEVVIKSPYLIGDETNTINAENIKIQGKVGVKITLPVNTIRKTIRLYVNSDESGCYCIENNRKVYVDCEDEYILKEVEQKYVEYRGDISYFFNGESEINSGYLVDHKFYTASYSDDKIEIDTYIFIEDGLLKLDDCYYEAEFLNDDEKPTLKLNKYKEKVIGNQFIGLLNGYSCSTISDSDGSVLIKDYKPSKWKRVSKFSIIKQANPKITPEDVMFAGYKHYVVYEDENYYLKDIYDDDGKYLGFGAMINGIFCPEDNGYIDEELFSAHHDLESMQCAVYVPEIDESLEVHDSLVSFNDGGKQILLMDSTELTDIEPGNFIIGESNGPIKLILEVSESYKNDEEPYYYVNYRGKEYEVIEHLYDTVRVSDIDFMLTYLNDEKTSASTVINGETMYFDINDSKAILSNKVYYKKSDEEYTLIGYGINENGYDVTENSGVTINGNNYPIVEGKMVDSSEMIDKTFYFVNFTDIVKYTFRVNDVTGSNGYLCEPVIDDDFYDDVEGDSIQRSICDMVVNNWKSFTFTLKKDTFGDKPFTPENGLIQSMNTEKPYTMSDAYLLENKIDIFRLQNYISLKFPLLNKSANNIIRDDIIKKYFVDDIKNQVTNNIVDMEKDVYYPVYIETDVDGNITYKPISQLRFNLHFRTRNMDNWKIIEDDREFKNRETKNSRMSNWFIMDYSYYNDVFYDANNNVYSLKLQNSSDLLGLMNFSTSEIKNRAAKIKKSFLRLSYYSTNDKKTQVLLATSTIFFDENYAYKKFIDTHRNSELIYIDTKTMQNAGYEHLSAYTNDVSEGKDKYQVSSSTITDSSEVYGDIFLNDNLRLSSRFVINDKYLTDSSSEGYYLYMFKEYTKKLHKNRIYLKVEFNHAGIGQTVPFMFPREINEANEVGVPLYLNKECDVKKLKDGFKMQDIYKQIYIPIDVIYDEKENKYVYFLPDEIRENDALNVDNEIMEFNLFEVKFANESIVEYDEDNTY